jgi:hypothetical protein
MKRRSFFTTILLAIGSVFVPRRAQSVQVHTSGYLQGPLGPTGNVGPQGPVGPGPCPQGLAGPAGKKAFSNRFLSRYEGRPIPNGVVFGQVSGGINHTPFHSQQPIKTEKLRSTTKDES